MVMKAEGDLGWLRRYYFLLREAKLSLTTKRRCPRPSEGLSRGEARTAPRGKRRLSSLSERAGWRSQQY